MKKQIRVAVWVAAALGVVACSADEGTSGSGASSGFSGAGGVAASGAGVGGTGGFAATGGVGGFGGAGGAGTGGAGGNSCASGQASAARVTPTVMLVVDGSCSMSAEYPGTGDAFICVESPTSRWAAIRNALIDPANGVVNRLQGVVRFGLGVYGTVSPSGMQCPFVLGRIDPALDNAQAIITGLPAIQPGLSTPTAEALTEVFNFLPDASQVLDQDLGPQIVILATDGNPNSCSDFATQTQPQSIAAAMMGRAKGIEMFVVSLAAPNGPLQAHLQQMANIGAGMDATTGTATLFAPTDPAALATTLEQIIGGALGCEVALNGRVAVGMECSGTVELNSIPLGCNDANGWVLADESHVRLQGTACDEFKNNPASIVRADFPCNVFIPD